MLPKLKVAGSIPVARSNRLPSETKRVSRSLLRRRPKMRLRLGSLLVLVLFLASVPLYAGDGVIHADTGALDFQVNFRYPPTPAQIQAMRDALSSAADTVCDETDGQVRFGRIRLTAGAVDEDRAAIWSYAEPGRSALSFFN